MEPHRTHFLQQHLVTTHVKQCCQGSPLEAQCPRFLLGAARVGNLYLGNTRIPDPTAPSVTVPWSPCARCPPLAFPAQSHATVSVVVSLVGLWDATGQALSSATGSGLRFVSDLLGQLPLIHSPSCFLTFFVVSPPIIPVLWFCSI